MKIFKFIPVVLAILTLYAADCNGIMCYTCTRDKQRCLEGDHLAHEDCDSVLNVESLIGNATACVKIVERYPSNNTFHIERGCRPALIATQTAPVNGNATVNGTAYCTHYLKQNPSAECIQCEDYFCNDGNNGKYVVKQMFFVTLIPLVMWIMKRQI